MSTLNDLIKLAKADGGKFFVLDEAGEVKLVIMPLEEYKSLTVGKAVKSALDPETVNKQIIKAQLEDVSELTPASAPKSPQVQSLDLEKRDLREEVIDLSFDFDGPKTDFDDL